MAAIAIVLLWGLGWMEPPEPLTRALAQYAAVSTVEAGGVTVDRIPCAPLPRLRLYVVCTEDCAGVWRVIGVRGLRTMLLANPGRVPPEPREEAQRRINDAIAGDGLDLDEAGARAMIGCHLALDGMLPDLILTDTDRLRIEQASGDEERLQVIVAGLIDPESIERLRVEQAGERWETTFDYWATELPGRPIYELRVVLKDDGRLENVETLPVGVTVPGGE